MSQNTQQFIEEMNAHHKQKGDILKEEEEEAYQKEPSSTYWLHKVKKRSHLPYMIIHILINNTKKNHLLQQWLPYKKQWLSPQKWMMP